MRQASLPEHSQDEFPRALDALLRALPSDPLRPVTMRHFFNQVPGWTYDALRKMTRGQLKLSKEAMEAMADTAGIIGPTYFREYRLIQIGECFSEHPELDEMYYGQIMRDAEALRAKKQSQAHCPVDDPLPKKSVRKTSRQMKKKD